MPENRSAAPPIPATCEHRPTIGGLVIPWANVALADGGADFRSQHQSKVQRCWREQRCQLCGNNIRHPIVLLGGPRRVAALQFDEPPLHPECAVYATKACPMVAGRISHYANREPVSGRAPRKSLPRPRMRLRRMGAHTGHKPRARRRPRTRLVRRLRVWLQPRSHRRTPGSRRCGCGRTRSGARRAARLGTRKRTRVGAGVAGVGHAHNNRDGWLPLMAVSKRLRYEVLRRDNHACRYCGGTAPDVHLTVDHVVAVALGGRDEASNLVAACRDCNAGKSSAAADAHLVDDVAEDAVRWARAMRQAGEELARADAEMESILNAVDRAWTTSMPMDWRASVVTFIKAGLTEADLLTLVDVAYAKRGIGSSRWTYFCGCCWNRVRKMQERAKELLQTGAEDHPSDQVQAIVDHFNATVGYAHEVIGMTDDEYAQYRSERGMDV